MKIYEQLLLTFGAIFFVCLSGNLAHASAKLTNTMSQFNNVYLLKNKGRDYRPVALSRDKATGVDYLYNGVAFGDYGSGPSMTLRVNANGESLVNAPDYADVFGTVTKNGENGDKINLLVDMYTGVYYIATEDGALTLRVNKDGKPYVTKKFKLSRQRMKQVHDNLVKEDLKRR